MCLTDTQSLKCEEISHLGLARKDYCAKISALSYFHIKRVVLPPFIRMGRAELQVRMQGERLKVMSPLLQQPCTVKRVKVAIVTTHSHPSK